MRETTTEGRFASFFGGENDTSPRPSPRTRRRGRGGRRSIFVRHNQGDGGLRVVNVQCAASGDEFDQPRCAVVVADIKRNGDAGASCTCHTWAGADDGKSCHPNDIPQSSTGAVIQAIGAGGTGELDLSTNGVLSGNGSGLTNLFQYYNTFFCERLAYPTITIDNSDEAYNNTRFGSVSSSRILLSKPYQYLTNFVFSYATWDANFSTTNMFLYLKTNGVSSSNLLNCVISGPLIRYQYYQASQFGSIPMAAVTNLVACLYATNTVTMIVGISFIGVSTNFP